MIPNTNVAEVTGNMSGIKGKFALAEDSLAHIVGILTNMYSDSIMACVREYSCNAHDSHVEAGQTRPIEITLPTRWAPTFTIQDFGVGMNVDDLNNTYSLYGASTKRASNDYVGMLGIGSKSALAYTHSFTVTGIKGGVRTQAVISIGSDGVPEFQVLDTSVTDEDNGVSISIPVKMSDYNLFAQKCKEFFAFWAPDTVLINGNVPKTHEFEKVDANVYLNTKNYGWMDNPSYIVMGQVAYRLDNDYVPNDLREAGVSIMIDANIGDVTIAPSREALIYTPETVDYIKERCAHALNKYLDNLLAEFDNPDDPLRAFYDYNNLSYNIRKNPRVSNLTYKGTKYNTTNIMNTKVTELSWNSDGSTSTTQRQYFPIDDHRAFTNYLIVVGSSDRPSTGLRRRLHKYLTDNDMDLLVKFVTFDVSNVFLDGIQRMSLDDARKLPAPKTVRGASNYARVKNPPFDAWLHENGKLVAKSLDEFASLNKTVVYLTSARLKDSSYTFADLAKWLPDAVVVNVPRNREAKFLRDHGDANPVRLKVAVQNEIDGLITNLPGGYDMSGLGYWLSSSFVPQVADVSRIDDPDLVAAITSSRSEDITMRARIKGLTQLSSSLMLGAEAKWPESKRNPLINYPLLSVFGYSGPSAIDDVYIYLNAKYAEMRKNDSV